jgi:hypothetical protein
MKKSDAVVLIMFPLVMLGAGIGALIACVWFGILGGWYSVEERIDACVKERKSKLPT